MVLNWLISLALDLLQWWVRLLHRRLNTYVLSLPDSNAVGDAWPEYSRYLDSYGFVILAYSEGEARNIAQWHDFSRPEAWWIDPKLTTCELVNPNEGGQRLILDANGDT